MAETEPSDETQKAAAAPGHDGEPRTTEKLGEDGTIPPGLAQFLASLDGAQCAVMDLDTAQTVIWDDADTERRDASRSEWIQSLINLHGKTSVTCMMVRDAQERPLAMGRPVGEEWEFAVLEGDTRDIVATGIRKEPSA